MASFFKYQDLPDDVKSYVLGEMYSSRDKTNLMATSKEEFKRMSQPGMWKHIVLSDARDDSRDETESPNYVPTKTFLKHPERFSKIVGLFLDSDKIIERLTKIPIDFSSVQIFTLFRTPKKPIADTLVSKGMVNLRKLLSANRNAGVLEPLIEANHKTLLTLGAACPIFPEVLGLCSRLKFLMVNGESVCTSMFKTTLPALKILEIKGDTFMTGEHTIMVPRWELVFSECCPNLEIFSISSISLCIFGDPIVPMVDGVLPILKSNADWIPNLKILAIRTGSSKEEFSISEFCEKRDALKTILTDGIVWDPEKKKGLDLQVIDGFKRLQYRFSPTTEEVEVGYETSGDVKFLGKF